MALAIVVTTTIVAHAQMPGQVSGLSLSMSASSPLPGDTITITAQSYSTDLNAATISWSENGKVVQKGIGLTSLNFLVPPLGKKATIKVVATTQQGSSMNSSLTINPSTIDLIIETDGYMPPSFQEKGPIVFQNTITLIAIPHLISPSGKEYDPKMLIYKWTNIDGTALKAQSGYGKQSISLAGSLIPRAFDISVSVTSRDGSAHGDGIVNISPTAPSIGFYTNDPLYGPLYNTSISPSVHIGSQKEVGVIAVPFGFNTPSGANSLKSLKYAWSINGVTSQSLADHQTIVLRAPDSQSGSSNIQLNITNPGYLLQQTTALFSTIFADQQQTQSAVTF